MTHRPATAIDRTPCWRTLLSVIGIGSVARRIAIAKLGTK
jgi:hypothetical protein